MNKKLIILIIVVVILLIISSFVYSFLKRSYVVGHNSRIDFSCNVNSDCIVKTSGCNCCGNTASCMNKNSVSGICNLKKSEMMCDCAEPRITACECINNKCRPLYI